jgi:hypothetical protein
MGPDGVFWAGLVIQVDCIAGLATQAATATTIGTTTTTTTQVEPTISTVGELEELPFTGPLDDPWVMVGFARAGVRESGARWGVLDLFLPGSFPDASFRAETPVGPTNRPGLPFVRSLS